MTEVLLYLLGVVIVFVGVALSIALHEVGHLLPAKIFRVKVTQFMVGFGSTLWSRKRGETEYGVKAIPLGGYVSMIGMYPPAAPGKKARPSNTGFMQQIVGEAREASAETIGEGEEDRAFYRLSAWKKIIIMAGGPMMNLVLAFVFMGVLVSGIGVPQTNTTLSDVSACLVPANSTATECTSDLPAAPAAAAGLLPGDTLLSIDGVSITDWSLLRNTVAASPGVPLSLEVQRGSETIVLSVTPAINERVRTDEHGEIMTEADGSPATELVGMIGATPGTDLVPQPITDVPVMLGENIVAVGNIIINMPQRLVDVWNAAFGSAERDANGPLSVVGIGRIAGEVVSHDTTPVLSKIQTMVGLLASLNIALFVFNLLPLPPLDGGHIVGALYEAAKRRLWRLFGKADPGPVDTAKLVPVTLTMAVLFIGMTLLLVYADIVKPIALFG